MTTGRYFIYNRLSGLPMDISDESSDNGANLIQWEFTGKTNQQFEVVDLHNGYYAIMPYHSGKSIDVWDRNTAAVADVRQYSYLG